jgi:hypothetical protein
MTKGLQISDALSLPIDVVTQKLAFLGRTGSGKTYAATKLAELMLEAGAQIVALDPVGKWHGLRLKGTGSGFEIPVFGGLQGDVPLESTAGGIVADLIVDRGISAVLDVSQMLSSEQMRFATDFAKQFFQRKKTHSSAVHLFLEECQEFVPQNTQGGEAHMLHAYERLLKLGRNFGIGASLLSQRPQEVNKKALNQTECLFAFQMTGPQERKAMVSWMSDKGMDTRISDALPGLAEGTCLLWSPSWLRVNTRIRVSKKRTSDVSSTPKVGAKAHHAEPLTPIDIEALRASMAATIERAKADDPRELRKTIADLKKQIAAKPAPAAPVAKTERVEVAVVRPADVKRLEAAAAAVEKACAKASAEAAAVLKALGRVAGAAPVAAPRPAVVRAPVAVTKPRTVAPRAAASGDAPVLGKCERAILSVLATHGTRNKFQLAIQAGYSSSSGGYRNSLGALRSAGLIEGGGEAISITDAGTDAAGDVEPLPQGRALIEYWLAAAGGKCERQVLAAVVDAHPRALTKEQVAEAAGYESTSGGFRNALGRLRSLQLIAARGDVALTETLGEAAS